MINFNCCYLANWKIFADLYDKIFNMLLVSPCSWLTVPWIAWSEVVFQFSLHRMRDILSLKFNWQLFVDTSRYSNYSLAIKTIHSHRSSKFYQTFGNRFHLKISRISSNNLSNKFHRPSLIKKKKKKLNSNTVQSNLI